MKKELFISAGIIFFVLIVIIVIIAFSNNQNLENYNLEEKNKFEINKSFYKTKHLLVPTNLTNKYIGKNISKEDVLVSFRIDDITFSIQQKQVLANALLLARKYNITFDLAVTAETFHNFSEKSTFKTFDDNQDVFEIVAHGYNNKNNLNLSNKKSEFKGVSLDIQDKHIREMKNIFEMHNLSNHGSNIFILPWNSGDENTILLSIKHNYKIIAMKFNFNESNKNINNSILLINSMVGIKMVENLTNQDIASTKNALINEIKNNSKNIHIIMHPINFNNISSAESLIKDIIQIQNNYPQIKFGMISERMEL